MPAGRPRKYADNAAKQAAYNERLREAAQKEELMRLTRVAVRQKLADDAQVVAAALIQNFTDAKSDDLGTERTKYLRQIIRKLKSKELRIDIDLT